MPIKVKYDDVTTYKVDAILNSLGVYGNIYGKLCENIITKAKDEELKAFIDKQNNPIGTVLVTNAGKLNCKNIIHVVTPFKKDDDENNSLLIKAYRDCLNKALELGHKSIAMPFIGTGANGYSDSEAYNAIGKACREILIEEDEKDKDIIDITIVGYLSKINKYEKLETNGFIDYGRGESNDYIHHIRQNYLISPILDEKFEEVIDMFYAQKNLKNPIIDTFNLTIEEFKEYIICLNSINPNELWVPKKKYTYPYDFFDDYINETKFDKSSLLVHGYDRKKRFKMKMSPSIKKMDIYRLAFFVGMNYSCILQWLFIAGYSFSPLDKLDRFLMRFMSGEYGEIKDFYELNNLCFNETEITLTL